MRPILIFVVVATTVLVINGEMAAENENQGNTLSRPRRYPEHLDPNYSYWVRLGECPELAEDGTKRHYCPTPDQDGEWICVDDYQVCNGERDCPGAEDESSRFCIFYKAIRSRILTMSRFLGSHAPEWTSNWERIENDGGKDMTKGHRQSGRFSGI